MKYDPYKQSISQHIQSSIDKITEYGLEDLSLGIISVGEYASKNISAPKNELLPVLCAWLESCKREQGDLLSTRIETYDDHQKYLLKRVKHKITGISILIFLTSSTKFKKIFQAKHRHATKRPKLSAPLLKESIKSLEFSDLTHSKDADFLNLITNANSVYYRELEMHATCLYDFILT